MRLPNAYAEHKGGTRSLRDARWYSIDFTLDVLGGCAHHCPGCFVNRQLPFIEDDLRVVADLTNKFCDAGYDFNELFLGPTDLFSASNFDQIVTDHNFKHLSEFYTFTCTTTCLNDTDEMKRRLALLEDCENWRDRNFEVFVIIDVPRYLSGDREYMTTFNRNLELLYNDNVFMLLNVYGEEMFYDISLFNLNEKVKEDYNTKVRVNPSYFRGTSKRHVERYAHLHKKLLEEEITDENIGGIFINMLDVNFGGYTFGNFAFTNHELYVSPMIYEALPVPEDRFKIPKNANGLYDMDVIEGIQTELFMSQHDYSKKTNECENCKYLSSCVSRNVLSYMESRGITDCFLPKELFRDASKVIELETRHA